MLGLATGLALITAAGACSHTKRTLIFEKTIALPAGRFAGPIEIAVPRRPENSIRDFEIRTELRAGCGPLLRLGYPDGEVSSVGDRDENWQALLSRRAENLEAESLEAAPLPAEPSTPLTPDSPQAGADASQPIESYPEGATAPQAVAPVVQTGTWQRTTTESWPGQLEFMRWRDHRCGQQKRFTRTYTTAYDENGKVSIWAEVPQELANAELYIGIYEITDVDREERIAAAARANERRALARSKRPVKAKKVKVSVARPPKPRPAMPKPKHESPKPAKAQGAIWSPGQWHWQEGRGKWVWVWGHWNPPAQQPGLLVENTDRPPVAGCTWQQGHWTWVPGKGAWSWVPGYWNEPPPRVENPGSPPVPESPWVAGQWQRKGQSFEWIAGYWGKPSLRAEAVPTPPYNGARWRPGAWLKLRGEWVWSAGFYEQSNKPPPPRKTEKPGTSPMAGAVWLAGFWRWDTARSDYSWIAGHWESPPAAGYEWIPDPIDPVAGYSVSGQWKLRIDVNVPVEVRR